MPNLAERLCNRRAIRLLIRSTHISLYPNWLPPARSVAQLPGSIYPTLTRYAGPKNERILLHTGRCVEVVSTDSCTSLRDTSELSLCSILHKNIFSQLLADGRYRKPARFNFHRVIKIEFLSYFQFSAYSNVFMFQQLKYFS